MHILQGVLYLTEAVPMIKYYEFCATMIRLLHRYDFGEMMTDGLGFWQDGKHRCPDIFVAQIFNSLPIEMFRDEN